MARIPYFDPEKAEGRAKEVYKKLPPLNIFRMLGHSGEMLDGFIKLGNQILMFSELDPVLREIAIVRTGVLRGSTYEVYQHKVYVNFVVSKTGEVGGATIARGISPSLDAEALRVVENLPKWKPGMQRGQPVNVRFTVPINFVLQ